MEIISSIVKGVTGCHIWMSGYVLLLKIQLIYILHGLQIDYILLNFEHLLPGCLKRLTGLGELKENIFDIMVLQNLIQMTE